MRTALACAMLLAIAGCSHRDPVPTAPTGTTSAGGGANTPTSPAVPAGSNTVSGVVSDAITGQPLAGVSYSAFIDTGSFGYSYMWATGAHQTDANGRYQILGVALGASVRLQLWTAGYAQQCAAPAVVANGDVTLNTIVVPNAQLSASSAPWMTAPGARTVSGTISVQTADGPVPAAHAFVDFEPIMDFPAAVTYSDPDGHYLLCGLPDATSVDIGVNANGRVADVIVPAGQTSADIVVK